VFSVVFALSFVLLPGCGGCGGGNDVEDADAIPPEMDIPGFLEIVDANRISGWAWDRTDRKKNVTVDIYADGKKVASVTAKQFRGELPIRGKYGFSISTPKELKDGLKAGKTFMITAKNADEDDELSPCKETGPIELGPSELGKKKG
jgi:hypothetical protein